MPKTAPWKYTTRPKGTQGKANQVLLRGKKIKQLRDRKESQLGKKAGVSEHDTKRAREDMNQDTGHFQK